MHIQGVAATLREMWASFLLKLSRQQTSGKILQPVIGFSLTFLILFNLLYFQNDVKDYISLSIAVCLGVTVAVGMAYSKRASCVSALSVPYLTTEQGRLILLSVVTGLVLGGPVANIAKNTNEVSKIVSCVANISYQHGLDLKEVYQAAYDDITEAVRSNTEAWDDLSQGLKKVFDPISDELLTMNEEITNFKAAVLDATASCKNLIGNAVSNCREGLGWDWTGIGDLICNALDAVSGVCSPFDIVSSAFGNLASKILDLLTTIHSLLTFEITYKDSMNSSTNSSVDGDEIQNQIQSEFDSLFDAFILSIRILQYIFIAKILLIPLKAWKFLRNYLSKKTTESSEIVVDIKDELKIQFFKISIHFLITAAIFCFDYILYRVQYIVETHGDMTFEASGQLGVSLEIQVGPVFQDVVNNFIQNFNVDRNHTFTTSTSECLPNPNKPNFMILIPILTIYVITLGLTLMGNWFHKTRATILQHFYPGEETQHN